MVASLLIGVLALVVTPREEEPQIKVPMVDVTIGLPGASAQEVERRVISPLEKCCTKLRTSNISTPLLNLQAEMIIVRFYGNRSGSGCYANSRETLHSKINCRKVQLLRLLSHALLMTFRQSPILLEHHRLA
ncbi:MAG: efflux RND transporter permease subunit [bacterium]|nr:efflux RND transporter permease subunit [bacterium]